MKINCNHYYDDAKGAVEIFGGADTAFKGQKIAGIIVDEDNRGYCNLCGKLTKANIPLEKCGWYIKIQELK